MSLSAGLKNDIMTTSLNPIYMKIYENLINCLIYHLSRLYVVVKIFGLTSLYTPTNLFKTFFMNVLVQFDKRFGKHHLHYVIKVLQGNKQCKEEDVWKIFSPERNTSTEF